MTISKTSSLQGEKREVQQLDEEIQIMKEKLAKMKVLNGLELELATLALLRNQYRSVRIKTENKMKELSSGNQKVKRKDTESSDDCEDDVDSMEFNHDIK
ncbi:Serine--tRNA ligase, mitochondrial [Mucor velutinosus]|uniref:Serine--tRNA ligase, mitochondrial n=1 Tax=Mucor velutinosus TaxID=708070 RepID=A0AAN7I3Y6_9FUNG|nr:Serine--tRNA ligase, mitochondrial [Mucor velutinosus]